MELKFIILCIFGVVSVVYLVTLTRKQSTLQFILKGCLMPLLLVFYITSAGINNIYWPVVLALFFAWVGDVLLIKITNIICFKLGLASFLIGHICYIAAMYKYIQPLNILVLIISVVTAVCFGVIVYKTVKPGKQMQIPAIAYETVILAMAICALQLFLSQFIAQGHVFGLLVFAGSVCFIVSDTLLALRTFRNANFYLAVMITYITAQFLITFGFCII